MNLSDWLDYEKTSYVFKGAFVSYIKQRNYRTSFLSFNSNGLKYISKNPLLATQNDYFYIN